MAEYSDEYLLEMKGLIDKVKFRFPDLTNSECAIIANSIRQSFEINNSLADISDTMDDVYEVVNGPFEDYSRDCNGTKFTESLNN